MHEEFLLRYQLPVLKEFGLAISPWRTWKPWRVTRTACSGGVNGPGRWRWRRCSALFLPRGRL